MQPKLGGAGDAFVTKFNPAGSGLVYSTYLGGGSEDDAYALAVDPSGNAYVTGRTNSSDFPLTNAIQTSRFAFDLFVTELNPSGGARVFSTVLGGTGSEAGQGIAIDRYGNVHIAAQTTSSDFPLAHPIQSANAGPAASQDAIVILLGDTIPPPGPVITLVANAEGETPVISANMWVEIKGTNLGPAGDTRIWGGADFVNGQMPTQLDGVSVTVNGKSAFVYYISPTQINILTPPDLISGPVEVVVTNNGAASASFTAQASIITPTFFVFGAGPYVAALHADYTFVGPTTLYPGTTTPAQPGEIISVYANGFGMTTNPVATGSPGRNRASSLRRP